ncbi:hypothetical protein CERSUDRAFT_79767 [Gelatoporia subvermispora B]|uniref:F-box domain-containing protein n=1 Tax=Ceriporiopsis subvermispora (strain B) TaxID=914234 RepID=M2RCJ3_CERS8|nr:hypothetical protein CERSUDRAFT_79767 [Gelatoporia subvermispora B]
MPNIPPELSDYIVDFLYNDPASLRACSLTCRAWVPTARLHLLEKVTLLTPRMCASFDRLMEASPNLGAYVQEFNVAKLTMTGMSAQDTAAALTMAEHVLPRIFTHLSNVRSFSVSCLDADVAIIISLAQHPSVSELILEYCQFPSFGDFVDLFHSFPQLRNLTMRGVTWRSKELGPRARPEPPRLQSVELGKDMDMSTLTRWMVEESLHRDVESLSIACVTEDDVIAAEPFLEALGPALKNLEFHWFCSGMYVTLPSSFTIESCTKLRTLSLHSPVTFDCYALPWITSLLSHIASNDIESIALEVRLLGDLNAINWEGIEELLAEPKFKSLRTLLIKVLLWKGTTDDLAEVKSDIRARLSQLELKGIVRM